MHNAGTGGQMVTPPDETTADPYAVIAGLRQQLAERSAERDAALRALAERTGEPTHHNSEQGERIEHHGPSADIEALKAENKELRAAQSAGLEVLQAMVTSP